MKNKYEFRGATVVIFLPRKDGTFIETQISYGDFDLVDEFPNTWTASYSKTANKYYVVGYLKTVKGKTKNVRLHRWIMEAPKTMVVDHISGDTLDNRRSNLRVVTHTANSLNSKASKRSTTGVVGVHFDTKVNKYHARVQVSGVRYNLGHFDDLEEAKKAVQKAKEKHIRRQSRAW